jgi:hypothetical protein
LAPISQPASRLSPSVLKESQSYFGKANRVQTPMKELMENLYGVKTENEYVERAKQIRQVSNIYTSDFSQSKPAKASSKIRTTRAAEMIAANAQRLLTSMDSQSNAEALFKMKKFANVKAKTNSNVPTTRQLQSSSVM